MTDEGNGAHPRDDIGGAPIDFDRLDAIAERFSSDERSVGSKTTPRSSRIDWSAFTTQGSIRVTYSRRAWISCGSRTETSLSTTTRSTRRMRSTTDGIATPLTTTRETTFIPGRTHRHLATTRHTHGNGGMCSRWSSSRSKLDSETSGCSSDLVYRTTIPRANCSISSAPLGFVAVLGEDVRAEHCPVHHECREYVSTAPQTIPPLVCNPRACWRNSGLVKAQWAKRHWNGQSGPTTGTSAIRWLRWRTYSLNTACKPLNRLVDEIRAGRLGLTFVYRLPPAFG